MYIYVCEIAITSNSLQPSDSLEFFFHINLFKNSFKCLLLEPKLLFSDLVISNNNNVMSLTKFY